jgi:hypothetical protein
MMKQRKFITAIAAIGLLVGSIQSAHSEHFKVFLCFGQSNMSGGAGSGCAPDEDSKKTSPRVKVLGFATSSCGQVSRTLNKWSDACEPMHCGDGQAQMGPSYVFGQVVADSFPNDTIGLIPAGVWGASIEMFMKGGHCNANQYFKPTNSDNARDWLVTKCQEAIKRGVFSGIILEQGESNSGDKDAWLTKVDSVYKDLKKTVPFDKDVPFVAGELLASGDGKDLNPYINKIPQKLPLGYVASSQGLSGGGTYPNLHFNTAGYRELGKRFGIQMVKGLKALTTSIRQNNIPAVSSARSLSGASAIYSLDGKLLATNALKSHSLIGKKMQPGKIYVIAQKAGSTNARLMIAQ